MPHEGERSNLGTLVADMERWGAGSTAVVEHRGVRRFETSYTEIAASARRFAAALEQRGVRQGDRVVLWGANSAAWMSVFFGCVLRGVLVVPLDAAGTPEFARRIVGEVAPLLIVGDQGLLDALAAPEIAQMALDTLRETLARQSWAEAMPGLTADTPLQILFTSGTTGEPKGVVHTHGNLLSSIGPIEREIGKYRRYERWVHPLRFLHTLPLSHVFGQFMGLWVPPLLGAMVHFEQRGTASHLAELIPRERINVLAAVPRTLGLLRGHLLMERPELEAQIAAAQGEPIASRWWRFRSVHRALGLRFWAAVCGGATLQPELEQFWTTLGFALVQGYGLTETAALVTLNHPFRASQGSLGAPLPGRELRLGATGELEVKGDMVAGASWQNGRLTPRKSPWLSTGDLASLGEDGQVRFLGRTGQRLVTAAGLNVYLQDVEQVMERQSGVEAAVVFALPGVEGGEEPAAVVLVHGDTAGVAVAEANRGLAAHQQVRQWWQWPGLDLPRTANGKVKRGEVERWGLEQSSASIPGDTFTGQYDGVATLLANVTGRRGPLADEARLDEDWGLDSMGRVALAATLEEQLGMAVTDGVASELRTVGELRRFVGGDARKSRSPDFARDDGGGAEIRADGEVRLQAAPEGRSRGASAGYPTWPWAWPVAGLRLLFIELFLRPMVAVLAAPRVRMADGRLRGPLLIIANHQTAMDVPLLLYALPFALRRKTAVAMSGEMLAGWEGSWSSRKIPAAAEEHRRWWGPAAAFLLRALLNVFPLPRTAGFRRGFAHAGGALDRGYSVLIFPEGRRSKTRELLPFKPGLGILAVEAFVPVLPVALEIADAGWFRSKPSVSFGPSVTINSTEQPEQLTNRLRSAVEAVPRAGLRR